MKDKAVMTDLDVREKGGGGVSSTTSAPKKMKFLAKDKVLHIVCCFAIAIGVALLVHLIGLNTSASGVIGFFAALIAGVAKEVYDVYQAVNPSSFSWKDILADVLGTLTGSVLWFLTHLSTFDFDEFLRFGFGFALLFIAVGVLAFPFVAFAMERKSLKKK